jgi:AmiR/NasT family two-component response regulator
MKMKNSSIKVLVAEDEYLVSEAIIRTLKIRGFQLIGEASTGIEAVEKACSLKPDVVLMDLQMPLLDGIEAIKKIHEICPIPIVVLTAYDNLDLVQKASEVGAGAYLIKPPEPGEIERAIIISIARHNDLMELRRLNKELERAAFEIKTLRDILPICSICKNIRDDKGYWSQVEEYFRKYSNTEFTHSICPECMKKYYSDFMQQSSSYV